MTPQQKAYELRDKFHAIHFMSLEMAKESALIAVNTMLSNAGFIWGGTDSETGLSARDAFRKYWNEVKEEIEKI